MLQSMIVASNVSNEVRPAAAAVGEGIRPLNARSLALSTLLGTRRPSLPGHRLVALAELFGIAAGTMRTALSRMVAAGELAVDDGRYRLIGRHLERQASQDTGRGLADLPWDGAWHIAVALDDRRPLDERRRARQVLADHRFAELRPDIWMRPANLPSPPLGAAWAVTTGTTDRDDRELATRLWDLDAIAAHAAQLHAALLRTASPLDEGDPAAIPPAFHAAAAVVRLLRTDPLLPEALTPPAWPLATLRDDYAEVEAMLDAAIRTFHAAA